MPRRTSQTYICRPLANLAAQLLRSPEARRTEQMRRAEQLHDELDSSQNYPLSFLVFRLTATRPNLDRETILAGEAIRPDLRLMIDQLSHSLELIVEQPDETLWRVDQLATRVNVSTKTLQRWRQDGLRWRWMRLQADKPHQIVIPDSAWRHFEATRQDRVDFAASFSQMSASERVSLLEEARTLAIRHGLRLNQVATRLAGKHGRALETVRMILLKHDEQHPDHAIFKNHTGPISSKQRRVIARAYRMGMSVGDLAQRLDRSRNAIYRILHTQRAATLLDRRIAFIASPLFEREDAEQVLLRQPLDEWLAQSVAGFSSSIGNILDHLPTPLRPLYDAPPLVDDAVGSLLVRYNFLKFKYHRLQRQLDRLNPQVADMDQMDQWWQQAAVCRLAMVRHHLPVVLSVARRQTLTRDHATRPGSATRVLLALLEVGNVELYEMIEQYNTRLRLTFASVLRNRLLGRYAREVSGSQIEPASTRHAMRRDEAERTLRRMITTAQHYDVDLTELRAITT